MRWLIALALVSCACPSKQAATGTTGGSGTTDGTGSGTPKATGCDAIAPKVQALYRADAQGAEKGAADPKRVEELVSDNTAMVLGVCTRDPGTVSACIAGVTTVKDLETKCMPKLDEEGSEADGLAR